MFKFSLSFKHLKNYLVKGWTLFSSIICKRNDIIITPHHIQQKIDAKK